MHPISGPSKLLKKLKRSGKIPAVSRLASLLTIPALHANTLRIELLVHLACLHCEGTRVPDSTEIDKWCNRYLSESQAVRDEDPIEQLMISNIMTDVGNFRIFNGIWDGNDFYLQQLLDVLFDSDVFPAGDQLSRPILALLRLTETLINTLHLQRWQSGSGAPHRELPIPSESELADRARALTIDQSYLQQNAIEMSDLLPFSADTSSLNNLANEYVGNSSLERRPLLKSGNDRLVFALPTAVSIAVRKFVIESLAERGWLATFQQSLISKQSTIVFRDLIRKLDGNPVQVTDLPPRSRGLPTTSEGFLRFDADKMAHVILVHDDLSDISAEGLTNFSKNEGQSEALSLHLNIMGDYLRGAFSLKSGLTIILVAGIGRPRAFGVDRIPPDWCCVMCSLSDFYLLAMTEDVTLLRLWKLEVQNEETNKAGLHIMNLAGELNLFSFWRRQNYCLISREMPYPGTDMMTLFSDFLFSIHEEVCINNDLHVVRYDSTFLRVRRVQTSPHFKEALRQPIFASADRVRNRELWGVVETSECTWWLIMRQKPTDDSAPFLFGFWEALLAWLYKLTLSLRPYLSELGTTPLYLFVSIQDLEAWPNLDGSETEVPMLPTIALLEDKDGLTLEIPKSFRGFLRTPTNIGERLLVEFMASGIVALISKRTGRPTEINLTQVIDSIIINEDARHMHFFQAHSPGQILSAIRALESPRLLQPEDESSCRLGLAWRVDKSTPRASLTGKETCKKFLERTVDQLWAEIAAHLKTVDRFSLIRAALQNNEAILRDREHWSNTARALIAIHEDKEDVRAVAHKRETERIRASLAGRVLIEMAICVAMNAGAGASKSDYDSLIARVISLIETAHVRDAMRYDLCPSRLEIHPNGFIGIDNNLIEDAVRKYNSESFGEQFRQASARYEHLYQIKEQRRDLQEIYSPEFLLAFEAEYGLTLERYIDVIAELWQVGVDLKECVVSMETPSLIERLLRREISDVDAMQFLNSFALQPRPKWEEVERPFRKQDFYPWRYQRRLSLTMRPIVWDGNVNRGQIIYGLQALVVSMSYLLGNIELGWLQQDNATSAEMKKLIGGISDTKGKEFEDEVSNRLQSSEWNTKVRIRLSSMGGPEELGDVDVFAWNKNNQRILAIECKRLKAARTVGEVGEQLKEFQGEARDRLGRHFQRIEWLNSNSKQAAAYLGIPFEDCLFSPLLVTNTIVPMQFKAGLPLKTEDIITLDSLIAN